MEKICLCIDVGGSSIKYARIDSEKNMMDQGKIPTPYEGISAYLDCLEGIYRRFQGKVMGISLSVPGIIDSQKGVCITAGNLRFAAAVAEFGMVLRGSENRGSATMDSVMELAESCVRADSDDYRKEFLELVELCRD